MTKDLPTNAASPVYQARCLVPHVLVPIHDLGAIMVSIRNLWRTVSVRPRFGSCRHATDREGRRLPCSGPAAHGAPICEVRAHPAVARPWHHVSWEPTRADDNAVMMAMLRVHRLN